MAKFVYLDETGSVGTGAKGQPLLMLVAAIVDEAQVQPLHGSLQMVARTHLGWLPPDFEFHGNEVWQGTKHWKDKTPPELLAAYEAAIGLLDAYDVDIAYSSIDKKRLTAKYQGTADANAYRLALQFLLEKIDSYSTARKVLVADESKEQELKAIRMVADLQSWGGGEVPGRKLGTIIDSLHFVRSHASSGVQMADLVAFVLQRRPVRERHPDVQAAKERMLAKIREHVRTWREPWPAEPLVGD